MQGSAYILECLSFGWEKSSGLEKSSLDAPELFGRELYSRSHIIFIMPRRVDLPPILHVCSLNRTQSSAQTVQPGR
jgi:hypothetical protein